MFELIAVLKALGWEIANNLGYANAPYFEYAAFALFAVTIALLVFAYLGPLAQRSSALFACMTVCVGVLSMWLSYQGEAAPTFDAPTFVAKNSTAHRRGPSPFAEREAGEDDTAADEDGKRPHRSASLDGDASSGSTTWGPGTSSLRHLLGWREVDENSVGAPFKDCPDCPEMVTVPKGAFVMGSRDDDPAARPEEQPSRLVRIPNRFAVGRFEITQGQYAAFVRETQFVAATCDRNAPASAATANHPKACVSWNDAVAYVAWLSNKTGRAYRLPSEAEWEYAARAGRSDRRGERAGAIPASFDFGGRATGLRNVGSSPSNIFDLHDMQGNVAELVDDCWQTNVPFGVAVIRAGACNIRTLKDGAWSEAAEYLRPAARRPVPADAARDTIGFRVVREVR